MKESGVYKCISLEGSKECFPDRTERDKSQVEKIDPCFRKMKLLYIEPKNVFPKWKLFVLIISGER